MFRLHLAGSGDCILRGTAQRLTASLGGSGNVYAFDLMTTAAEVRRPAQGVSQASARLAEATLTSPAPTHPWTSASGNANDLEQAIVVAATGDEPPPAAQSGLPPSISRR
jgi:hypothetical protein